MIYEPWSWDAAGSGLFLKEQFYDKIDFSDEVIWSAALKYVFVLISAKHKVIVRVVKPRE